MAQRRDHRVASRRRLLAGVVWRRVVCFLVALSLSSLSLMAFFVPPALAAAPIAIGDAYSVAEDNTLTIDWWNVEWTKRQKITFDNSLQSENLIDFVVLVTLNSGNIDYAQTQNAGEDLRFLDATGTALSHEIEAWNESGASSVWVRVPQIDGSSNTDFMWMYYGNPVGLDVQNPAGVWTGGYRAVYHLNEAGGPFTDSTGNLPAATNVGSTDAVGVVANGQEFDGLGQHIHLGSNQPFINGVSGATASAWIRPDSTIGSTQILGVTMNGSDLHSRINLGAVDANVRVYARSVDAIDGENGDFQFRTTDAPLTAGVWQHVTVIADYANDAVLIYVNGVSHPVVGVPSGVIDFANGATPNTNSDNGTIGVNEGGVGDEFDGAVDEARLSGTVRSADWVSAEYLSMTGSFANLGGEETAPADDGVVANDSDVDGYRLNAILVAGPSQASNFTFRADGTFVYTPNSGYSGPDSFTYKVNDGTGDSNVATVDITVTSVTDPPVLDPVGNQTTPEQAALTFTATASDPDLGDTLTFTLVGAPPGAVIDPTTGVFTWTPTETQGPGSYPFDIVVTDDGVPPLSDQETVTITVSEVNQAPMVTSPGNQTNQEGDTVSLLVAASDPDIPASILAWSAVGLAPGLAINSATGDITGTIDYTASGGSPYPVTVTVIDDGVPALSDQVTFTWTITDTKVNAGPVAVNDGLTVDEDTPGEIFVLANDSDPDGDPLTVTSLTQPWAGTAAVNPDGSVLYVPPVDFAGTTSFVYTVGDGKGGFATGVVNVVVLAVNDAPVGFADRVILTSYRLQTIHVLANDWDPDGDELHIESVSSSEHGLVEISSDGSLAFTPGVGWVGTDTFTYVVADPAGARDEVSVVVEMNVAVLQGAQQLAQQLGVAALPFDSPEPEAHTIEPVVTLAEGVTLLAGVFYQTVLALQLPLSMLGLALLMIVGLFTAPRVLLILTGSGPRYWSAVRLDRESALPVYDEPGGGEVIYNYDRVARGIMSTGSARRVLGTRWLPVVTPNGEGWVDHQYLSEQIDLQAFMADRQPVRLVVKLADRLRVGRGITSLISSHGLIVAVTGPPSRIPPERLAGLLGDSRLRRLHSAAGMLDAEADFRTAVADSFLEAYHSTEHITTETSHSRSALIPTECWNLPYLALGGAEGSQPWLVFFEYHRGKPRIAGIGIDE